MSVRLFPFFKLYSLADVVFLRLCRPIFQYPTLDSILHCTDRYACRFCMIYDSFQFIGYFFLIIFFLHFKYIFLAPPGYILLLRARRFF